MLRLDIRRSCGPRRVAGLLVIPLLATASAACGTTGGDGGSTGPGRVGDPKAASADPNSLVLRIRTVGGIAGFGGRGSMPDLSVYGGGRVIARGSTAAGSGAGGSGAGGSGAGGSGAGDSGWPVEFRLTPAAYERLVAQAHKAGLSTPRTSKDMNLPDSMSSLITFAADPRTPVTTEVPQGNGKAGSAEAFAARLSRPGAWPAADLATRPAPYRPAKVAVLATELTAAMAAQPWPFGRLGAGPKVGTRTCTELTGADVEKARRLAGEGKTLWFDHDLTYRVVYRPLLPDEPGCAALTRS